MSAGIEYAYSMGPSLEGKIKRLYNRIADLEGGEQSLGYNVPNGRLVGGKRPKPCSSYKYDRRPIHGRCSGTMAQKEGASRNEWIKHLKMVSARDKISYAQAMIQEKGKFRY